MHFDLGLICTPPDTHLDVLKLIYGRCSKILVEKPLSNNFNAAQQCLSDVEYLKEKRYKSDIKLTIYSPYIEIEKLSAACWKNLFCRFTIWVLSSRAAGKCRLQKAICGRLPIQQWGDMTQFMILIVWSGFLVNSN